MSFEIGQRVETLTGGLGVVAFLGPTQFAEGEWAGLILDEPKGKNNGSVQGVSYFECEANFGLFVKPSQIKPEGSAKRATGLRAPALPTARKDSGAMSRSGSTKPSPGSTPGISPAASSDNLNKSTFGMGSRTRSKLADTFGDRKQSVTSKAKSPAPPSTTSRMARESSNLSQSSVASSRAGYSRQSIAPNDATGLRGPRQSMAPADARKISSTAKPRPSLAPSSMKAPAAPASRNAAPPPKAEPVASGATSSEESSTADLPPSELPPPNMTSSGTEMPKESVLSKAKKIEDTAPATPMSPSAMSAAALHPKIQPTSHVADNSSELWYLKVQVKELTDKLETTRAKRKDDHTKLLEFERISIEHRTLQEVKGRLNDKVVELERSVLEEKKVAEELRAWRESNKDTIGEHQEAMELATIEKELAEERAETLQSEVTELTEKLEMMETELEVLREEMATGGGMTPAGNSVQMRQIEQQNEKLKDALIKLRDLNGQATVDKQKALTETERLRAENSELIRIAEGLKRQAELAESKIAAFQEQIDAAMGAEEMVTQLTNKNFDMEEKISQLEEKIEDLEEARDLDEQIAETQKQVEKDLMKEIEGLEMKCVELNGRIRDEQKHAAELSKTILKFRERVALLNSEIQEHKDQVLTLEEELHGHRSEDIDRASMVSQLQVTANKNFSEAVERQVNAIELEYARRQAGYLKAFLPDNFAKLGGDNESILMCVMLPRLAAKAKLFAKLASDCYPQVPGGMRREHVTKSHKPEQWAHVARVAYIANSLVAVLSQMESAVNSTTVEVLMKLTEMLGEMSMHERAVDQYLDLLKSSRFDENTSLENFEKPLLYFQNVFSVHIGIGEGDAFNSTQWISALCSALTTGLAYCRVNTQRLRYILQESVTSGDVVNLINTLNDELAACESVVIKAGKLVPTDSKKTIKLDSEFTEELLNAVAQLDRISSVLREVCSTGALQISGVSETEGLDEQRMREMIHGIVVKFNGWIAVEKAFEPIRKYILSLRDSLEKTNTMLESGRMERAAPEKNAFPPLLDRAHHRKQAASEAEGLRWQMEKKDNEMLELRKQIKARIEDVSNYKLRLDMSESRLNSSDKQGDSKVKHLEEKIDQMVADHKRKQIEHDETMDTLQREMKELGVENAELKQRANNISKITLWKNIQSMESKSNAGANGAAANMTASGSFAENSATQGEVIFLEQQLHNQTEARKRAELEVMRLRGDVAQAGWKTLGNVPGLISGPITLEEQDSQDQLLKLIDELHNESLRLRKDQVKYLCYPVKLLDYSAERQREEIEKWENEKEAFFDRLNSVNRRLCRVWQDAWNEPYPFDLNMKHVDTTSEVEDKKIEAPQKIENILAKWGLAY